MVDSTTASAESQRAQQFTVLDWIGSIMAAGGALGLLCFPIVGRNFSTMFQDFGTARELPALTRLAVSAWFPVVWAALAASALAAAGFLRLKISERRALVIAGFVVACVGFGLCLVGVYLPIFALAESVKAD